LGLRAQASRPHPGRDSNPTSGHNPDLLAPGGRDARAPGEMKSVAIRRLRISFSLDRKEARGYHDVDILNWAVP
jgi:hypothetical protein